MVSGLDHSACIASSDQLAPCKMGLGAWHVPHKTSPSARQMETTGIVMGMEDNTLFSF